MSTDLSLIVPAFNEEQYLPQTLAAIQQSVEALPQANEVKVEIVVVDNASTDNTPSVARQAGAIVVQEPVQGIARARNSGARTATGRYLVFVDADTIVPPSFLGRVYALSSHGNVVGGAVDTDYRPRSRVIKGYLMIWRVIAGSLRMAQGVTQFCTRTAFEEVGGYDESMYMSEDVDFYWRLQRYAKEAGAEVAYVSDIQVVPSTRRFDKWPLWRTLLMTNPIASRLFLRSQRFWGGWYRSPPR